MAPKVMAKGNDKDMGEGKLDKPKAHWKVANKFWTWPLKRNSKEIYQGKPSMLLVGRTLLSPSMRRHGCNMSSFSSKIFTAN